MHLYILLVGFVAATIAAKSQKPMSNNEQYRMWRHKPHKKHSH